LDALPPSPPAISAAAPASAPGDIYPRSGRERELCAAADHPDWLYLGALGLLDFGAIAFASNGSVKYSEDAGSGFGRPAAFVLTWGGPVAVGLTWGATIGGGWLSLPKCSPTWVGEPPPEGGVRETWPLAMALALLAGATAPVVNGIAIGSTLPESWSDEERVGHIVAAGVAGFVGALVPYLVPPRTWSAARELERLRVGVGPAVGGGASGFVGYGATF
jgi:hypothetical protein